MNKRFFLFLLLTFFNLYPRRGLYNYTVMLDPAGDAKQTGRVIEDSLERAITIQFAHQLQEAIESFLPNSSVIITRSPGEVIQPLQNANYANRLPIDLYVSIHFFNEPEAKPTLYLYQFSLGDTFITRSFDLAMIPYDKAHQLNGTKTIQYAKQIHQNLMLKEYQSQFFTKGPFQLPYAPLIGIKAPAIGLEMNLVHKNDWHRYVDPIARSIVLALEQ